MAFGILAIFVKWAYQDGAGEIPLLALRFVLAALLLVSFHLVSGRSLRVLRAQMVRLLLLGGVGYAFEASLFFLALDRAPAGIVTLVFYSFPLWTAILTTTFGLDKFRLRLAIALALGAAGVISILSISGGSLEGALLALGSSLAVAVYFLFAQILIKDVDPSVSATWTCIGAALSLGAITPFFDRLVPAPALLDALGLGVATAIAFGLLYAAIARIGSARTSVAAMVEPVTTVILAAVFLGERITWRVALGAALVLSALPVLASAGRRDDGLPPPDSV